MWGPEYLFSKICSKNVLLFYGTVLKNLNELHSVRLKFSFRFQFDDKNLVNVWNCAEIDHKHAYKFSFTSFGTSNYKHGNRFNIVRICVCGNQTQRWLYKLYKYYNVSFSLASPYRLTYCSSHNHRTTCNSTLHNRSSW